MFRVVGYLPGPDSQATIAHDLRAGVAQASMEETAENANAGVQGENAMEIRVAAWRSQPVCKRCQFVLACRRMWRAPGALPMKRLSPSAAQAMAGRLH